MNNTALDFKPGLPLSSRAGPAAKHQHHSGNALLLPLAAIAALLPIEGALPASLIPLIYAALLGAAMAGLILEISQKQSSNSRLMGLFQRRDLRCHIAFVLVAMCSLLWAADSLLMVKKLAHNFYMLALIVLVAMLPEASLKRLWRVLVLATFVACLLAIYRISFGQQQLLNNRFVLGNADENFFAMLLLVSLSITFFLEGERWWQWLRPIMIAVLAIGVVMSGSRTGLGMLLLLLPAAGGYWLLSGRIKLTQLAVLLTVTMVGAAAAMVLFADIFVAAGARYQLIFSLRESGLDTVTNGRSPVWAAALKVIADHPWFGVGHGNFPHDVAQYSTLAFLLNARMERGVAAHSAYLATLAETGVIGFSLFAAWLIAVLRLAWVNLRRNWLMPALLGSLVILMIAGLVLNVESFKLLALVQGSVLSLALQQRLLVTASRPRSNPAVDQKAGPEASALSYARA